jgi:hypothetical protein
MKRYFLILLITVCLYRWYSASTFFVDCSFSIGNGRKVRLSASHETWWEPRHGMLGLELQQWDEQGYWVAWNKWVWIPF